MSDGQAHHREASRQWKEDEEPAPHAQQEAAPAPDQTEGEMMREPETDIYDWLMSEHGGDKAAAFDPLWDAYVWACREVDKRHARESWGYLRKGNAYGRAVAPKPRTTPLDIAKEEPPHG